MRLNPTTKSRAGSCLWVPEKIPTTCHSPYGSRGALAVGALAQPTRIVATMIARHRIFIEREYRTRRDAYGSAAAAGGTTGLRVDGRYEPMKMPSA